jgi:copper chaperone NosL
MNRLSTTLVWIAVILCFGAFVFPLWSISLSAPQYPEGMGMHIWISKITGEKPHDLQNINGLNHYIGMKEIHAEMIPELGFMKYIVMGLIALGAGAALLRKRWLLMLWVVVAVLVAVVGLVDFYKWSYDYGHNLNPDAPIKVPGMTYQPPLIGSKKLLNITATSLPAPGGAMMMLAVTLGVVALVIDMRRKGRGTAKNKARRMARPMQTAAAVLLAAMTLSSCSPRARPIAFGTDSCHYCMMTIVNEQYGAEIVTKKGRVYTYDSVECMAAAILKKKIDPAMAQMTLTIDFANPRQLVDANKSVFLHSSQLRSPMGMNLTSFADPGAADGALSRYDGELFTWEETLQFMEGNLAGGTSL